MQKWHKQYLVLYFLILSLSFGSYWVLNIPCKLRKIVQIIAEYFEKKIILNGHFYFLFYKNFDSSMS
jgi:hypothetical protein